MQHEETQILHFQDNLRSAQKIFLLVSLKSQLMWQLWKHCGYSVQELTQYSGLELPMVDTFRIPLDPISCQGCCWHDDSQMLAGCIETEKVCGDLSKAGMNQLERIIRTTMSLPIYRETVLLPPILTRAFEEPIKPISTARKWQGHIASLQQWGILKPGIFPYSFATYFAVPKNEDVARAIFNGHLISSRCRVPPPVNLPSIPSIIDMVRRFSDRPFFAITGDIRHFFHGIRLNEQIARFYGIRIEKEVLLWSTLPMGHSWSPLVAQITSWAWLTYRDATEKALIEPLTDGVLPNFRSVFDRKTGTICGFVTVYYDNYIVIATDYTTAREISNRLLRNAKRYKIHLKEHNFFTPMQMRQNGLDFLGISILPFLYRGKDDAPRHSIKWRVSPSKTCKWELPTTETPRMLARAVGQIVWAQTVSLEPIGHVAEALKMICDLPRPVPWDQRCVHLTNEQTTTLKFLWNRAKSNEWVGNDLVSTRIVYGVTDSSGCQWASITFGDDGHVIDCRAEKWNENIKGADIFIKESICAIRWITGVLNQGLTNATIRLAVDNTSTQAVLTRLWSRNGLIEEELRRLRDRLKRVNVRLQLVHVPSASNAADAPSRGKEIQQAAIDDTWRILAKYPREDRSLQSRDEIPSEMDDCVNEVGNEIELVLLDAYLADGENHPS